MDKTSTIITVIVDTPESVTTQTREVSSPERAQEIVDAAFADPVGVEPPSTSNDKS